jgi:hypothetical protein
MQAVEDVARALGPRHTMLYRLIVCYPAARSVDGLLNQPLERG